MIRAIEELSEADRWWFATHPRRSFRLRRPAPGELAMFGATSATHVLVIQVAPGFRLRRAATITGSLPDNDAVLSRLAHDGFVHVGRGGSA